MSRIGRNEGISIWNIERKVETFYTGKIFKFTIMFYQKASFQNATDRKKVETKKCFIARDDLFPVPNDLTFPTSVRADHKRVKRGANFMLGNFLL